MDALAFNAMMRIKQKKRAKITETELAVLIAAWDLKCTTNEIIYIFLTEHVI
jgi:hypothetical protein